MHVTSGREGEVGFAQREVTVDPTLHLAPIAWAEEL